VSLAAPAARLNTARVDRAGAEAARLDACRRLAALGDGRDVCSNRPPAGLKSRPPHLDSAFGGPDASPAISRPGAHGHHPDEAPCIALGRKGRGRCLLCVWEATAVDGLGRLVSRLVIPVTLTLAASTPRSARDLARSIAQLGELQATVREEAEEQLAGDRIRAARAALAYQTRLTTLIDLVKSSAPPPVQASLFDGRATRRAAERVERLTARVEALERRREAARYLATVAFISNPCLLAVVTVNADL
jgi:hypothetical protein